MSKLGDIVRGVGNATASLLTNVTSRAIDTAADGVDLVQLTVKTAIEGTPEVIKETGLDNVAASAKGAIEVAGKTIGTAYATGKAVVTEGYRGAKTAFNDVKEALPQSAEKNAPKKATKKSAKKARKKPAAKPAKKPAAEKPVETLSENQQS